MRNGFYILQEQYKDNILAFFEALDKIETELPIRINDSGDLAGVSVGSFLQGFCGELAKYFNRECRLPIGILYAQDDGGMRLFYVFNVFRDGSTTYYLDACGITDDQALFEHPFIGSSELKIVYPASESEAKVMFGNEWDFLEDNISDAMIRWLLTSFPENYKHPALSPPPPLNGQIHAAAKRTAIPETMAPVRLIWIRDEAGSYHSEDGRFDINNVYDRMLGDHWSLLDRKTNQTYEKDTLKECKWIAEGHVLPHERQKAQNERLENIYTVFFLDTIHFHVHSEGQIVKKAVYIVVGIDLDGKKDVLGMWVGKNESVQYWASVLNNLRNRGVEDIFIACTDNLTGFSNAIEGFNRQLCKVTKAKSVFLMDGSLFMMLYLTMMDITKAFIQNLGYIPYETPTEYEMEKS